MGTSGGGDRFSGVQAAYGGTGMGGKWQEEQALWG